MDYEKTVRAESRELGKRLEKARTLRNTCGRLACWELLHGSADWARRYARRAERLDRLADAVCDKIYGVILRKAEKGAA